MAHGNITGARNLFTKGLELGLPEAALALARAYDPEYLAQVSNANSPGDADRAAAMYREWHRRSVAAGTLAPGVQGEKLIHPMPHQ